MYSDIGEYRVYKPVSMASIQDRIYIADAGLNRVVVLSNTMEFDRFLGAPGEGPGEFNLLSAVCSSGDSLVTLDISRFSLWGAKGEYLRSFQRRTFSQWIDLYAAPWPSILYAGFSGESGAWVVMRTDMEDGEAIVQFTLPLHAPLPMAWQVRFIGTDVSATYVSEVHDQCILRLSGDLQVYRYDIASFVPVLSWDQSRRELAARKGHFMAGNIFGGGSLAGSSLVVVGPFHSIAVIDKDSWNLTLIALEGVSYELSNLTTHGATFNDLIVHDDTVILCSSAASALVTISLRELLGAAEHGLALEPVGRH